MAQTIAIATLSGAPIVDGENEEWQQLSGVQISLRPTLEHSTLERREVLVKAGQYQKRVYFYLQWPDKTHDTVHKPYVWNETRQRYVRGEEREDRLALQFEMSGEYSTDWSSAQGFTADMWHWKSSRSNPLGLAHDKITILSKNKLLRAAVIPSRDGNKRYVLRKSDSGKPLYRSLRYGEKEQETMPKYQLLPDTQGSIADIKAKGIWRDGFWHLELSRSFDTGHSDDVQFERYETVLGGIAIFDASENEDHLISETLLFQF